MVVAFQGIYIYIHTRDCSPTGPTSPFQRVIFNITNPNNAKGKSLKIFPKICYLMFDPPKMGPIYIMTPLIPFKKKKENDKIHQ